MTKKEIRKILRDSIKNNWIKFKNYQDREYILLILKTDDLEDVFSQLEVCEIESGWDFILDMIDEFDNL